MAETRNQKQTTQKRPVKKTTKRMQKLRRQRMICLACGIALLAIVLLVFIRVVIMGAGSMPETSTLTVKGDEIVYQEVEAFDSDTYSVSDFKKYVKSTVREYNEANPVGSVTLDTVKVKDSTAYVQLTFENAATYADFNGMILFDGTIAQAKEAGYDFNTVFAAVGDSGKSGITTLSKATADADARVLILKEFATVDVDGTVTFVSDTDTTISDGQVVIAPADGNYDAAGLTYIIYQED